MNRDDPINSGEAFKIKVVSIENDCVIFNLRVRTNTRYLFFDNLVARKGDSLVVKDGNEDTHRISTEGIQANVSRVIWRTPQEIHE